MTRALLERVEPDAPIRLDVAARLAFPDGSISGKDLKRLARENRLGHYVIAGMHYTTLADVREVEPGPMAFPLPEEGRGLVYVVGFGQYVKIGFTSRNLEKRLSHLRTGAPETIVVWGVVPGTRADEKAMHVKFARFRLHGEWFKRTKTIRDWITAGCPL